MRGYTQLAEDSFHYPNQTPIPRPNWGVASNFDPLAIHDNLAVQITGYGGQFWATPNPFPPDQYVEATMARIPDTPGLDYILMAVTVRGNAVSSCYYVEINGARYSQTHLWGSWGLYRFIGDNYPPTGPSVLYATGVEPTFGVGGKLRLEAVGTAIQLLYNGVLLSTIHDPTLATGQPGLFFRYGSSSTPYDTAVSLFTAGSISTGAPSPLGTTTLGTFEGRNLKEAVSNPEGMDLIQVLNQGGKVVWGLTASGIAKVNPVSPSPKALLGQFFGNNFVEAFPNFRGQDIFKVVNQGNPVFFVGPDGAAYGV